MKTRSLPSIHLLTAAIVSTLTHWDPLEEQEKTNDSGVLPDQKPPASLYVDSNTFLEPVLKSHKFQIEDRLVLVPHFSCLPDTIVRPFAPKSSILCAVPKRKAYVPKKGRKRAPRYQKNRK